MNIKRVLLSGLFTLLSGSMMSFGAKSKAEVTSWVSSFPKVTSQNIVGSAVHYINESCQATSEGQHDLSWASVTYIIAGRFNQSFAVGITIPAGQTKPDNTGGIAASVPPGSYDCIAIASGTDTVTADTWAGSTGDTWLTVPWN